MGEKERINKLFLYEMKGFTGLTSAQYRIKIYSFEFRQKTFQTEIRQQNSLLVPFLRKILKRT